MTRWFGRRKRMVDNLDQEIPDFIERETQDNIARGMTLGEAPVYRGKSACGVIFCHPSPVSESRNASRSCFVSSSR